MKTTMTITATIDIEEVIRKHCKERGETMSEFFTRAIVNQLEKDGNFDVRDYIIEKGE